MRNRNQSYWTITLAAAAILLVVDGSRRSLGLFVSPLNTTTGLGIASISFAMAVGQFIWGAAQPVAGAVADRYGPGRVLAAGFIVLAVGSALTPYMNTSAGLIFSIGILSAAGGGACSFSVLFGAAAQRLPVEKRGMASGIINAGGSVGQFLFAPMLQKFISGFGVMAAMWSIAIVTLAALPLARVLRRQPAATHSDSSSETGSRSHVTATPAVAEQTIKATLKLALADHSYLLLHASFFTCGFHIAFLTTHLPGEVQLCGLPAQVASWSLAIIGLANIVGSLAVGWGTQIYRSKFILFWMYFSRAVLIAAYLFAPKTATTFYLFSAGLGLTWLATIPPTAGLVGKLFGVRYLGTLFGLTLLSHQIGGFFGAWLGGIAVTERGSYAWMWYADIALALFAALCNLPIKEAPIIMPTAQLKTA